MTLKEERSNAVAEALSLVRLSGLEPSWEWHLFAGKFVEGEIGLPAFICHIYISGRGDVMDIMEQSYEH